jgi:mono/diheme cytochrome c family protein
MEKYFYQKSNFFFFLLIILLSSCLTNVEEEEVAEEPIGEEIVISFKTDVKPIIDTNCASCHGPNTPNLTTISSIMANSSNVKGEVVSRRMPIGKTLTTEEINTIVGWIDAGALDN